MAEIFLARTNTEGFNKQVCIKRVLPHFLESKDFITMFRDEAALAAKLQHGNVVQVFDFGQEEDTLYLAMEYIDGADLRQLQKMSIRKTARSELSKSCRLALLCVADCITRTPDRRTDDLCPSCIETSALIMSW